MGANTIRKHHNFLNQLFEYAIKHPETYGIYTNPVAKSTPPSRKKSNTPNLEHYNVNRITEMLESLHRNGDIALECAVLIALFAGARQRRNRLFKMDRFGLRNGYDHN